VKPDESPEMLPFVPPFSLELIEGDGVMPELFPEKDPFWPSERVVSFERQTCVGPMGEYSVVLPGAGAGAGGMGAAFGAVIGVGAGAPQPGAIVAPQPQLGAGAGAQPHVGAGAQPQWWWWTCLTWQPQWPALAKGATAMQIAPTIKQIETRFDIFCSPILKNRSQETLDRFPLPCPQCPWRPVCRTSVPSRLPLVAFNFDRQVDNRFVTPTDPAGRPGGDRSLAFLRRARMVSLPTFIDRMDAMRELRS
jgi:hypothetical protein